MDDLGRILFVGSIGFGCETPGSRFVLGLAKALRAGGYQVEFLPGLASANLRGSGTAECCGFPYHAVAGLNPCGALHGLVLRFLGIRDPLLHWLNRTPENRYTCIISYPRSYAFQWRLRRYCLRNGIKQVAIEVEWHALIRKRQLHPLVNLLWWVDSELQRRWATSWTGQVIGISRHLTEYYQRRGCRAIRVPPLMDLEETPWKLRGGVETATRPLRLLFSGSHQRDRQDLILSALLRMRQDGRTVQLEYLGCTAAEFLHEHPDLSRLVSALEEAIHFHGRVPTERVAEITASADFGILLREDARWSRACFPFKVPEFFSLGLPVICNLSSDLELCLVDGRNSLIVRSLTSDAFRVAVERALHMRPEDRVAMCIEARRTAAEHFDYRAYVSPLCRFIREL